MADTKKIFDYLDASVKDYAVGVDLIAEFGSPTMAASYRNASPRFMMPQVLALLRRLARTSKPTAFTEAKTTTAVEPQHPKATYPKVITEAKNLLHSLYQKMVDFHNQLLAMGDDNSTEKCAQRVELMKLRQPYIDNFVLLDDLVRDFFATDQVPDKLVELVGVLTSKSEEPAPETMAEKLKSYSDLDLALEYKRTKSSINRRINKLRFQSSTSKPTLNPMPDSPARKKVEAELKDLKAYIKAILAEQQARGLKK